MHREGGGEMGIQGASGTATVPGEGSGSRSSPRGEHLLPGTREHRFHPPVIGFCI